MKLRNKKTGEIIDLDKPYMALSGGIYLNGNVYDSLKELNANWEDYEEPKKYWTLDGYGYPMVAVYGEFGTDTERDKEIGNYFETKEEAEKAVAKLKAWKRLKDKGFRFCGFYGGSKCVDFEYDDASHTEWVKENRPDLDLLFGGKE